MTLVTIKYAINLAQQHTFRIRTTRLSDNVLGIEISRSQFTFSSISRVYRKIVDSQQRL